MADQKQHIDLYRKIALRRQLLRSAVPGAAYVPFIGDGDIAHALYRDRPIYGADKDAARLATCESRDPWPAGITLKRADCDKWPWRDEATPAFALADFDAYSYPYEAFRAFWTHAEKRSPLVLFFTDGQRQSLKRGASFRAPDGEKIRYDSLTERRRRHNFYLPRVVKPWFSGFLSEIGWRLRAQRGYIRGADMAYWGAVIELRS